MTNHDGDAFALTIKIRIRELQPSDYDSNFIPLLRQLSTVGSIEKDFFHQRLQKVLEDPDTCMLVAEDMDSHRICATGTMVAEPKFIHSAGMVGHLEDVVVDSGLRGKGVGRRIVRKLCDFARARGCYKVLVDCASHNQGFYQALGFQCKGACMSCYFEEAPGKDVVSRQGVGEEEVEHWHEASEQLSQTELRRKSDSTSAADRLAAELEPQLYREEFVIRRLQHDDYAGNFLELLSQLTTVGTVSEEFFKLRLDNAETSNNQHILVIENKDTGALVAAGTLFVEQKFIHSAGLAGHIEDIVVDSTIRGKGLGRAIVDKLRRVAFAAGCYKAILDCGDHNVGFYRKCGFELGHSPVSMALYFSEDDVSQRDQAPNEKVCILQATV